MSKTTQCFSSRYIVDVSIEDNYIKLGDSAGHPFYIDKNDKEAIQSFKLWFKAIFLKGVSGTLTVFEYEKAAHDGQVDFIIKKFLNIQQSFIESTDNK